MDTFTHHFCAKGHGVTIETGFPINKGSADGLLPSANTFASPLFTQAITTVPPLSKVSSDLIPAAPTWLHFRLWALEYRGSPLLLGVNVDIAHSIMSWCNGGNEHVLSCKQHAHHNCLLPVVIPGDYKPSTGARLSLSHLV